MSVWVDLARSIRKLMVMQDQLDRLNAQTREIAAKLEDHSYRLIRVETIIDLARKRQLPVIDDALAISRSHGPELTNSIR